MIEANNMQCANVQTPVRAHSHITPDEAHNAPHTTGGSGSLKAAAQARLQQCAERTLLRTMPRTLPEKSAHITPGKDPLMCGQCADPETPALVRLCERACKGLRLDAVELAASLTPEDAETVTGGAEGPEVLRAYALAVCDRKLRERGIAPAHYTARTHCKGCGLVPIFEGCPPQVEGCPWCWNRVKGLPVPKVIP